jgi:diaphanous 1
MRRFAASVQHITGQELDVKAASESDPEQELEALRIKVEELSDEVNIHQISISAF